MIACSRGSGTTLSFEQLDTIIIGGSALTAHGQGVAIVLTFFNPFQVSPMYPVD